MKNPTLAIIKSCCDEEGEMWLWRGRVSDSGSPRMTYRSKDASVYRVAYALFHQIDVEEIGADQIWPTTQQRDTNPRNLMRGSRAQFVRWKAQQGLLKRTPSHRVQHTKAARARSNTKLSMERAREARVSDESNDVLAQKWGVSVNAVRDIRIGRTWRETVLPAASIFSMGAA